jgi:hypothetical protein
MSQLSVPHPTQRIVLQSHGLLQQGVDLVEIMWAMKPYMPAPMQCGLSHDGVDHMRSSTDIAAVYHEFTEALTEVLAENAVGVARRGRLARAHAAVKKHPDYSEPGYILAVEMAFTNWEAIQNIGR